MPFYKLGNMLRGGVSGEFESDEEAWEVLSKEFDKRIPSKNGRKVYLEKLVKEGYTKGDATFTIS